MKSVELFVGAGGLALGTAKAGFAHQALVEWDEDACRTIKENQRRGQALVRHWPVFREDVTKFDFKGTIKGSVDLVSGGPPCQPWSNGGKHKGKDDQRNLFSEVVRAIRELQPRAILIENVKGITRKKFAKYFEYILLQLSYPELSQKKGEDWDTHLARLEKHHTSARYQGLSYRVIFRLLNAANFGVPQKRERVFIVGFRSDLGIEWRFPQETHSQDALLWEQWVTGAYWERNKVAKKNRPMVPTKFAGRIHRLRVRGVPPPAKPWLTVRDAISSLPDPENTKAASAIPNHVFVDGARSYKGHTGSPLDEPAKTLKAGVHGVPGGENMLAKPDGSVRYFTVREAALLQTFPRNYVFSGAWGENMRQLGNAVPVTLAELHAKDIRGRLELK